MGNLIGTLSLRASALERNRLVFRPGIHDVENSAPIDVSAENVCFVPRLDSNVKPGKSSRNVVT